MSLWKCRGRQKGRQGWCQQRHGAILQGHRQNGRWATATLLFPVLSPAALLPGCHSELLPYALVPQLLIGQNPCGGAMVTVLRPQNEIQSPHDRGIPL